MSKYTQQQHIQHIIIYIILICITLCVCFGIGYSIGDRVSKSSIDIQTEESAADILKRIPD